MIISKAFIEWTERMEQQYLRDTVSFSRFDNESFRNDKRKRGYIAIDKRTGKTARSFCNPSDNFDPVFGRAIAYARLRGITIPSMEVLLLKNCFGKTVRYKGKLYYVTPVIAYCGVSRDYFCLRFEDGMKRPTVTARIGSPAMR